MGINEKKYSKEDIFNNKVLIKTSGSPLSGYIGNIIPGDTHMQAYIYHNGDVLYDMQPDIFKFSFNGIDGSFIIGNDGKVNILEGDNYSVDLSGFMPQDVTDNINNIKNSSIKITTLDGFVFVFGGNNSKLEIIKKNTYRSTVDTKITATHCEISAWHLSEIIAPNGRKAVFSYGSSLRKRVYETYQYTHGINYGQITISPYLGYSWTIPKGSDYSMDGVYGKITEEAKINHLLSVVIDDAVIEFNHNCDRQYFASNEIEDICKLNKLIIRNKAEVIKQFDFTYTQNGKYHFLAQVKEPGKQPYKFQYIGNKTLPEPSTGSLDVWGYWRGLYTTGLPHIKKKYDNGHLVGFDDSNVKPVNESASYTLLNKIIYPTGGHTLVEYEQNTYSSKITRTNIYSYFAQPVLTNEVGYAGGVRVKKITDNDGIKNTNVREYKYVKNYPASYNRDNTYFHQNNSGVLNESKNMMTRSRQILTFRADSVGKQIKECDRFGKCSLRYQSAYERTKIEYDVNNYSTTLYYNSYNGNYNLAQPIQYAEITELNSNKSYSVYKFTTLNTHPDVTDYNRKVNYQPDNSLHMLYIAPGLHVISNHYLDEAVCMVNDKSRFRGRLSNKNSYTKDHGMVYSLVNSYNDIVQNDYVACINNTPKLWYSYKMYTTPCRLTSKQESQRNTTNTNFITTNTQYEYNSQNLISQTETTASNGDKLTSQYRYLTDVLLGGTCSSGVYKEMLNKGMTGILLESITKRANKVLETKVTTYKLENNLVLPYQELFYFPSTTSSNYQMFTVPLNGVAINDLSMKIDLTYNLYNTKGNIIQFAGRDGIPISVVWGYNYQYPVAKVAGCTFANIKSALSRTGDANNDLAYLQSYTGSTLNTQLEKLKTYFKTNNNIQVINYNHKPLVGMTSETSPQGTTAY